MYASLVVGAGLTDSLGLETMISSGSEVFRRTGGREGGLAVVLMARVGFRTGSLGAMVAARAGIEWGTTTAGLGGEGLEDLPPVSFLMKDENDDPDRWGLGRGGTALELVLRGIATGLVVWACGGGLILIALLISSIDIAKEGHTARVQA
jgi:hypothetical protein